MPLKDLEARKEYGRRHYAENRERIRAERNAFHHAHKDEGWYRERRAEYGRRWKAKRREIYLAGRSRRRKRDRADPAKGEVVRAREREWWLERRAELVAIADAARATGCIYCGESVVDRIDFHHRDPRQKAFTIGKALQRSVRPDLLLAEIAKCDIVCANCHIKHHLDEPSPLRRTTTGPDTARAARYRELRRMKWGSFIDRAKSAGCTLCPERHPEVLQFHHFDETTKVFEIMHYVLERYGVDLPGEVEKCVVLCASCHRCVHKGSLTLPQIDLAAYWLARLA